MSIIMLRVMSTWFAVALSYQRGMQARHRLRNARVMFSSDWASALPKRVVKFVFKRSLGRLLKGDVDLDQMDVQLSTGKLELRDVLLNIEHINTALLVRCRNTITTLYLYSQHTQQADTPWRLTAGYVRRVGATVPFTSLQTSPCEVELDEVVVHARLLSTVQCATPTPTTNYTAPQDDDDGDAAEDTEPLPAGSSIADGVRVIAGGIENLLHQLCVRVRNLSVHVVAPADAPGSMEPCLLLTLAAFTFSSSDNVPESSGVAGKPLLLDKRCSIDGLLLELLVQPGSGCMDKGDDGASDDGEKAGGSKDDVLSHCADEHDSSSCSVLLCNNQGAGCAASLRLRLESNDGLQSGEVAVDILMEPLQLQIHSSTLGHLVTMAKRAAARHAFRYMQGQCWTRYSDKYSFIHTIYT